MLEGFDAGVDSGQGGGVEVVGVGPVGELGEGSVVVVAGEVVAGALGEEEIVV